MKTPDHLFISSSDGSLYDTRKRDWSKLPPLRADYVRIFRHIENTAQLRATLRAYPSYQTVFHTDDWASLCGACVRKEWRQISPAIREMTDNGWRVHHSSCSSECSSGERCDHCDAMLDPFYDEFAEPETN